jgi:nitroreductase
VLLLIRITGPSVPRDSAALALAVGEAQLAIERLGFGTVVVQGTNAPDLGAAMQREFVAAHHAPPPETTSG